MTAYLYRMPNGIEGTVNRYSNNTIEPARLDPSRPFRGYGRAGKIDGQFFVPLEEGDTAADVYGLFVRSYPTQQSDNTAQGFGDDVPVGSRMGDVLKRGYVSVRNRAGVPAHTKPVYARVGGATNGQPIGGIEASPDSTAANSVELNAIFMDAGDADGNVEIAYNI